MVFDPLFPGMTSDDLHHGVRVAFNAAELMRGYNERMVELSDLGYFMLCAFDAEGVPHLNRNPTVQCLIDRFEDDRVGSSARLVNEAKAWKSYRLVINHNRIAFDSGPLHGTLPFPC